MMLGMATSSCGRLMGSHVSLLNLHSSPAQVHRSCWAYSFSYGTHCRNLFNAHTAAFRRESNSTFRVYAAKPGFGAQSKKQSKKPERRARRNEEKDPITKAKQILAKKEQPLQNEDGNAVAEEAPSLLVSEEKQPHRALDEELFEQKLADIKRAAAEQKILEEQKKYAPIDYDAPPPSTPSGLSDNLGAKIGIGLAVVVFGLLFALGDFLPSWSPNADKSSLVEKKQLTKEESSRLQVQVKEFEDVLQKSPEDRTALEGAAVSYAELGEYDKAEQYLSKITQKSPTDVNVLRVLAEVQNEKGDYDASISSYRAAIRASGKQQSLPLLQGLTDNLLAAKKPSEAVGELLAARSKLNYKFDQMMSKAKESILPPTSGDSSSPSGLQGDADDSAGPDEQIDPITLELLLGKAYAAWDGHTGDAATVYDGLIKSYPEDYRGYLAKGVLLKTQNKPGDAERMFIQARYLAPTNSKSIVDIYSGRRPS